MSNCRKTSGKAIEVVAGLFFKDNKFMICQRPVNKARGLLWEFVGGKVEPGETKDQALIRECSEELGCSIAVGKEFFAVTYEYPDLTVHLTVFIAELLSDVHMLEHNDIRFIDYSEVENYEFCPADIQILEKMGRVFYSQSK